MRKLLAVLMLALAAPAAGQQDTLQSDRQLRQRTGWAISQLLNGMLADSAQLAHLNQLLADINARVVADSLANLPPALRTANTWFTVDDSAAGKLHVWVEVRDTLGALEAGVPVVYTVVDGTGGLTINGNQTTVSAQTNASGQSDRFWIVGDGQNSLELLIDSIPAVYLDYFHGAQDTTPPPPPDTLPPPPPPGSSPHYTHARFGGVDYRIHYQSGAQKIAEYDWLAAHHDYQVGGSVAEMLSRNPNFRTFVYDQLWMDYTSASNAASNWLAANGWNPEDAFLHYPAGAAVPQHVNAAGDTIAAHTASGTKTADDRLTHKQYGGKDFYYYNVGDLGYRAWRAHHTQQLVGAGAWSIFFDTNSISAISKYATKQPTLEFPTHGAYMVEHEHTLAEMRQLVPAGYVCLNQSTYFNRSAEQALAIVAGCTMTEFVNASHRDPQWDAVDALVAAGVTVDYSGQASDHFQDVQYGETAGNYADVRTRRMLWDYASYLMVVDPLNMDLVIFNDYIDAWNHPHTIAWLDAYEVDVGLATGARYQLQGGTDPAGQTVRVWARDFDNALVLIRKQENQGSSGNYDFSDTSAVAVNLPAGTWYMLQADGTLSSAITSVQLRCGEAVILIRG